MNMIVNTSDLVGYEAENIAKATSARSKALAKAVAIWEKNQFKSAKKNRWIWTVSRNAGSL
jgi:hypothetical protein